MYAILYVDDEKQNLLSFKASFRRKYKIFTALSGELALGVLEQESIDLIITDQRMPGMTGVEFLEKTTGKYPDLVRMILTGYSDVEAIIAAINTGQVNRYLAKPWKINELEIVIEDALESYNLKQQNRALEAERNELLILSERQKMQNILSQFETLRNQLNPHFLFNCLNVLASLVYEDADLADDFISKMTKVYRYLLEQKDEVLIPLEEEIKFLNDYFFLQKIRFKEGLNLEININSDILNSKIPVLSLQLLVENAIKHNIVSKQQPLYIEVKEADGFLVVKNTLQVRLEKNKSTGIGLKNLQNRYALLTDRPPEFIQDSGYYVAKLPLI